MINMPYFASILIMGASAICPTNLQDKIGEFKLTNLILIYVQRLRKAVHGQTSTVVRERLVTEYRIEKKVYGNEITQRYTNIL
jgi:hypothetical protein